MIIIMIDSAKMDGEYIHLTRREYDTDSGRYHVIQTWYFVCQMKIKTIYKNKK